MKTYKAATFNGNIVIGTGETLEIAKADAENKAKALGTCIRKQARYNAHDRSQTMKHMEKSFLIEGDPMSPSSTDLIAQTRLIQVGFKVPDGWRVLTGSSTTSKISRIAYRYEIEEDSD